MRQYSIDRVEVSWLGIDFKPGLAAGTSITETRNAPSWTQKVGANGAVYRTYNPDRSGTLAVVVDQESRLHQQLRAIAKADANPATRTQVGPLVLRDLSSGEVFTYRNAYIQQEPDESRGVESATFTWTFGFESVDKTVADPLENVVGS